MKSYPPHRLTEPSKFASAAPLRCNHDRIDHPGVDGRADAAMCSRFRARASLIQPLVRAVGLISLAGVLSFTGLRAEPFANSSWVTDGEGSWADAGNWDLQVPGSAVNAIINQGNAVIGGTDAAEAAELIIATSGTGALTIGSGSSLATASGKLGSHIGAIGTAAVSGTWNNSGDIYLGEGGAGTLTIESGGEVTNVTAFMGTGNSADGSSGAANVSGTWNTGDLYLGYNAIATLNIGSQGAVNGTRALIASNAGSNGAATVSGLWENTGDIYVGLAGTGELTIEGGGAVSGEFHSVGRNEGSSGTLTIESGGTLTNRQDGDIGYEAGSTGTATVSGVWENAGNFRVGNSGSGTLTIESGGWVSTEKDGWMGAEAGSTGTATVRGEWTNTGNLYVGNSGTGTLTIESGGSVSNTKGVLGSQAGSKGTASVSGTWENDDDLEVGAEGNGTLTILKGGHVSNGGFGIIGVSKLSTSTATVSGTWTSTSQLWVGRSGAGTLDIESGGSVADGDGILGVFQGSNGTANVSGTWSRLAKETEPGTQIVPDKVVVGHLGTGTLNINDGGVVSASNVVMGNRDTGVGTVILNEGGLLDAGQIIKGDGTALLTVDGGTVRAMTEQSDFLSNFAPGEVVLASGGAIFDTNGYDIGVAAALSGEGSLTKSGTGKLTLSGSHSYSGTTVVTGGTLAVDGHLTGSSQVDVESGATFGGMGIIDGDVTISNGGILAAGDSVGSLTLGSLTLDSGSVLSFRLGDFSEVVVVNGHLAFSGSLSISLADGFTANRGDSFEIMTFDSVDGTFDLQGLTFGGGLVFQEVWSDHGLTLTVIPEPGISILLISGLAGLAAFSRLRHRRTVQG